MIGREKERNELNRLYDSGRAEFVAVYGRRRVGKTFLVDETFKGRVTFRHAGLSPVEGEGLESASGPLRRQLKHFYNSLLLHGMKRSRCPESWLDAFFMLEAFLAESDDGSRQLLFIDELPWLDTPRSGFVTALEGFWNTWGCHRDNLMLVVCGSATSWMADKLVNNKGGLYNRLTCEIRLSPFSLRECEEYFRWAGVRMSRYDIVQSYMMVGGIPYYLSYFRKGLSLPQNIDALFFSKDAKLKGEFARLIGSAFSNPGTMEAIIRVLGGRSRGYTREEIGAAIGASSGGTLTMSLNALVASDFVVGYAPFGDGRRQRHYKLADPFCLFYLHFVDGRDELGDGFWQGAAPTQRISAWRGLSFENVCFNHMGQIKKALGISGVESRQSAWTKRDGEQGAQIDLLIERADNVVNMCEMKFCVEEFAVDGAYDAVIRRREGLLRRFIPKRMAIHSTLVTTYGLKYGEYSGAFSNVVTMDDLFM